jgi:xanthine dehydrogenase large subunit
LRNAVKAFNPSSDISYDAPMTPEKVLMSLYSQPQKESKERTKEAATLHE